MIQRIQTVFLALVALVSGVLPSFLPLWVDVEGTRVYAEGMVWVRLAFFAAVVLAIGSMLWYKNRQYQFVINRLNILLHLVVLGFFVYQSLSVSGETVVSEKGIGLLIPVGSIVFLVLANRAIQKDEALVKSADRLR